MTTRSPAVAGSFYPFSEEALLDQLNELFSYHKIDLDTISKRKRIDSFGVIVPHAGYPYSGYVAAKVFADIPKVDTVVLIGPNHYGIGPNFSVSCDDEWETPLGVVKVDTELAKKIAETTIVEMDDTAHIREHSIEVQLPFLQKVLDDFKIVPISIKHYGPDEAFLSVCQAVGEGIANAINGNTLIVASTDFTHYESQNVASEKDNLAMRAIEDLDEDELFKVIADNHISMCGYAGVAANLTACKQLGAKKVERIAYMTSGDTTGDTSQVVGYGGLRIL